MSSFLAACILALLRVFPALNEIPKSVTPSLALMLEKLVVLVILGATLVMGRIAPDDDWRRRANHGAEMETRALSSATAKSL